jgi:hypothetical protein
MRALIGVFFVLGIVVPSYGQATQPPKNNDALEVAIEQMRHIATAMKACSEEVEERSDIATYYVGPPTNVEWDVRKSTTRRSPFQGIITFTLPERSDESAKAKRSKVLHEQ